MARASKSYRTKKVKEEMQDNFNFLISSLNTSRSIEDFFNDFLTEEEELMLKKRLLIHMMLEAGYRVSEIQTIAGVSYETTRTHHHAWRRGGIEYKKMLGKLAKRDKAKKFWKKVEKILKPIDLALKTQSDMKARAKLANADYH